MRKDRHHKVTRARLQSSSVSELGIELSLCLSVRISSVDSATLPGPQKVLHFEHGFTELKSLGNINT